jgi:hypothetical protein
MDFSFVKNVNPRSLSVLITTPAAIMVIIAYFLGPLSLAKAFLMIALAPIWLFLGIYRLMPFNVLFSILFSIIIWIFLVYLVGFMFYYRKSLDASKFHSLLFVYGLVAILITIGFLVRYSIFGLQ